MLIKGPLAQVVAYDFNPWTWETKTGRSLAVGGQSGLQNKFQDSQRDTRKNPVLKQQNRANKQKRTTNPIITNKSNNKKLQ